jgi:hypothetical protein
MNETGGSERWLAELGALRRELAEMRAEQRELAKSVAELATTFRTLATHLGIASEPYRKTGREPSEKEIPGFG